MRRIYTIICSVTAVPLAALAQIRIPATPTSVPVVPLHANVTVVSSLKTDTGTVSQTETGAFWRSSDGKTRQDNATSSVISDPTTGNVIHLDRTKLVATVIQRQPGQVRSEAAQASPDAAGMALGSEPTERLGSQLVAGFKSVGTRTQIPVRTGMRLGAVEIETWYAPDLGLALYSHQKRPDGELVQRYDNIEVGEPSLEVFLVPKEYTVRVGNSRPTEPIR